MGHSLPHSQTFRRCKTVAQQSSTTCPLGRTPGSDSEVTLLRPGSHSDPVFQAQSLSSHISDFYPIKTTSACGLIRLGKIVFDVVFFFCCSDTIRIGQKWDLSLTVPPPLPPRRDFQLTKEMVMEKPSAQLVGREFVRQYYTLLNQAPDYLHRCAISFCFCCLWWIKVFNSRSVY